MRRASTGFTLIELLISVGISVGLAAVAAKAFSEIRTMVQRRDALLQLHRSAETVQLQLATRLSMSMPHQALVADAQTPPVGSVRAGLPTLRLLWMRGKEHPNDWSGGIYDNGNNVSWYNENTDLYWELWEYRPEEQTLYVASSARAWSFTISGSFADPTGTLQLQNQTFKNMAQPRRVLGVAPGGAAEAWWTTLDDNRLFAPTRTSATSNAGTGDIGDWGHLQLRLRPVVTGMVELSVAMVPGDGSAAPVVTAGWDAAGSPQATSTTTGGSSPLLYAGIRQDGFAGDAAGRVPGQNLYDWTASDAGRRPVLLRCRWTLADGRTGIRQTFSHSFRLPGAATP